MKEKLIIGGIILALLIGTVAYFQSDTKTIETVVKEYQAIAGPDVYDRMFLHRGLTVGSTISTTTVLATLTTARATFGLNPSVILWNHDIDTTITLTASSTHGYVPKVGDVATIYIQNASTTSGATLTFTADAQLDFQFTEATGGDLVLNGLDWAKMTFVRTSAYVVTAIFSEFTEAD